MTSNTTLSPTMYKAAALLGSGCASTLVGFHLETLRIRLLLGNDIGEFSSLKRGISFSLAVSVMKTGCIWPMQEAMRRRLHENQVTGIYSTIISGGISNIVPGFLLAPFSITKVHLMRDKKNQSWFAVSYNIYRLGGIKGFYKGMDATMLRDSSWGMIYFPFFEKIRQKIHHYHPNPSKPMVIDTVSSFCAAVIATTFTSWIDAIRLHKMNQDRIIDDSFVKLLKRALAPTKANIMATALGVARVGIGTSVGHSTYLSITRYLKPED